MSTTSLKESLERWTGFLKIERVFAPRLIRVAASEDGKAAR